MYVKLAGIFEMFTDGLIFYLPVYSLETMQNSEP